MKECPCCGFKFNVFNYHLHTRILPENDSNYKSLHCLKCKHKIQKKESITYYYLKIFITFIMGLIFAILVRSHFDIWPNVDLFAINIPFILLFFIIKYIFDYLFSSLKCYDEKTLRLDDLDQIGGNINGIFGQKEEEVAEKGKGVIFWILTLIVVLVMFTSLK